MYLEYIGTVARMGMPEKPPMLSTFVVGEDRFCVEVGGARDAVQIERLVKSAVLAALADAGEKAQARALKQAAVLKGGHA